MIISKLKSSSGQTSQCIWKNFAHVKDNQTCHCASDATMNAMGNKTRDDFMMTSSNGNIFSVTGHLCGDRWIPRTKAVTRGFDVFFDLRLNKQLSKQSWGWWLETLSCSLWRQSNAKEGQEMERFGQECLMELIV